MTSADKSILVTGSAGFIGLSLTSALRRSGRVVLELDRAVNPFAGENALCVDLAELDEDSLSGQPCPPTIVHLAAVCKEPGYPWREYFVNNAEATRKLCRFADVAGVQNIVFTSTMMTFAAGPWRRSESDLCDPDTAYGCSKLQAEEILRAWQSARPGRRLRIVRPGVVFGLGDDGNLKRLVNALHRRRFAYIGRQDTVKGCIYVKDLVQLLIQLIDDDGPHDLYHAVYPEPTTIRDIVDAINGAWGWNRRPPTLPYRTALAAAAPFALLDPLGTRFGVHPRRIQKLYQDTNLSSGRLADLGFTAQYSLRDAFSDWHSELGGGLPL